MSLLSLCSLSLSLSVCVCVCGVQDAKKIDLARKPSELPEVEKVIDGKREEVRAHPSLQRRSNCPDNDSNHVFSFFLFLFLFLVLIAAAK